MKHPRVVSVLIRTNGTTSKDKVSMYAIQRLLRGGCGMQLVQKLTGEERHKWSDNLFPFIPNHP